MGRRFEGKTAVVTGGSRGIGASTARALAAEGARVVVSGRVEDVAQAAMFLASDQASWITGVVLDLTGGRVMA